MVCGGIRRRHRLVLLGMLAGLLWQGLGDAVLWRSINPMIPLYSPQPAALFSVLPHDQRTELLATLTPEDASRVQAILGDREVTADALLRDEWVGMPPERRVGEALAELRRSGREPQQISYIYVVDEKTGVVKGVVDLRELVLSRDDATLEEIMAAPVVAVEADDLQDDVHRLFAKYHFRMVPVVDRQDRILGVIQDEDVIKGLPQA